MAQVDRAAGLTGMKSVKDPCKAVAVANITLSGEQTVNGVAIVADDRVLVTAQTSSVDNGVYVVSATAWARATDFDGARDIEVGTLVVVSAGEIYRVTAAGTVGTEAITFELVAWQRHYDIGQFFPGKPTNGQTVFLIPFLRATTVDVDLALSRCVAGVAATASAVFNISKNGTNFGTMTFAIGGTVPTFVAAVPPAFAAGDYLKIVGPATADATLADIGFVFAGQVA